MLFYKFLQKPIWISLIFVLLAQSCATVPGPGSSLSQSKDIAVSKLVRISSPAIPQTDQDQLSAGTGPFQPIYTKNSGRRTATCSFHLTAFRWPWR